MTICAKKSLDCVSLDTKKLVRVLSLQGGGIRGYIELVFLSELEKQTKLPICRLFDLVGGTSIGGMLACALTTPCNYTKKDPRFSASYLRDNFLTLADEIFSKSWWSSLFELWKPKYTDEGIRSVAMDMFLDITFDKSLVPTMIPAYDAMEYKPMFFKSWREEQGIFYTSDVTLATSAAPTYFPAHVFQSLDGKSFHCFDGGLAVNDPSYCLALEARKLFGNNCNLKVISLGTGKLGTSLLNESQTAGILDWSKKIVDVLIDGEMGVVDYLMQKEYGKDYSRWNPLIKPEYKSLDVLTSSIIDYFDAVVLDMIEKRKDEFSSLATTLTIHAADK